MVLAGTLKDMCTVSSVFCWWKRGRSIVQDQEGNSTASVVGKVTNVAMTKPFVVTLLKLLPYEVRRQVSSRPAVLYVRSMDPLEVRG
jgi:hypothetical protein